MKERPILFSGPMVRAILDGRKTQTRRVVKPQPYIDEMDNFVWNGWNFGQNARGVPHIQALASPVPWNKTKRVLCPYGAPGDRLWVRETWNFANTAIGSAREEDGPFTYATYPAYPTIDGKWKPSIHMPRYASRLSLEITNVHIERLQGISEADAAAEGVESLRSEGEFWKDYLRSTARCDELICLNARDSFWTLWDSLNAARGFGWEKNPWAWVVEFRRAF
ncbi:hypothetical protein ACLKMY_00740 [Paraburkholderia mimosarum]|uniref:hypothetical protein n=1 Tax=Paraburkholderia mimosarum TaxID=312026 RepID=UPI0039C4CB1D